MRSFVIAEGREKNLDAMTACHRSIVRRSVRQLCRHRTRMAQAKPRRVTGTFPLSSTHPTHLPDSAEPWDPSVLKAFNRHHHGKETHVHAAVHVPGQRKTKRKA